MFVMFLYLFKPNYVDSSCKSPRKSPNLPSSSGGIASQVGDDAPETIPRVPKTSPANGEDAEDKAKVPVVQQKGRFKVTSENVDLEKVSPSPVLHKSHSMQVIGQNPASSLPSPTDATMLNSPFVSVFALLQSFLQTNIAQRESILSHMKQLSSGDFMANRSGDGPANIATTEKSLAVNLEAAHEREKELLHEVTELQWRLICAQEELQKLKAENAYFHN